MKITIDHSLRQSVGLGLVAVLVCVISGWAVFNSFKLQEALDHHQQQSRSRYQATTRYIETKICERIRNLEIHSYGFKDSGQEPQNCDFSEEEKK